MSMTTQKRKSETLGKGHHGDSVELPVAVFDTKLQRYVQKGDTIHKLVHPSRAKKVA